MSEKLDVELKDVVTPPTRRIPGFADFMAQADQQQLEKAKSLEQRKQALESVMIKTNEIVMGSMFPSQECQDQIDGTTDGKKPKGKRGRPRKEKPEGYKAESVVAEDIPEETNLKELVKCIKPFKGSPKDDLNGVGLTKIMNRNGEGYTSFIYATNRSVGAIAYVHEDTTLEDVAKYSIMNSIDETSAGYVLMPPGADELTAISLDILDATLEKSADESCYQIRFKLESLDRYDVLVKGIIPDTCAFKLDSYLIWTEHAPLITIDAYMVKRGNNRMFYRETSWGGWAVIGEAKTNSEEGNSTDPMEELTKLAHQVKLEGTTMSVTMGWENNDNN
jgi:hypothetical protein